MASSTEHPANVRSLKDLSTSILPLKQPSSQSSSLGTSPSLTNKTQFAASTPKTTPENVTSEKTKKWYRSLSRVDQLEFLVKIKIETFREHVRVYVPLCVPLCDRQWYIDEEEDERRRKFFEKKGEEAYWARYIDSEYTGRVEFLYVDPKEVDGSGSGKCGCLQT